MRWMKTSCSRNCSAARCSSVTSCTTPICTDTPSRERTRCTRERIQRTSPSGRRQRYSTLAPSWARLAASNSGRSSGRMPLIAYSGSSHSWRSYPAISHKPGDHNSTVSPGSLMRRQWPARARVSMVSNTSVCSRRSRRASASACSHDCRAWRSPSASDTSLTATSTQSLAMRRAAMSQASCSRGPSRSTWRPSNGTPSRATPQSWSISAVLASWSNTVRASAPGSRTPPSPGIRRAAALAVSKTKDSPLRRNSMSAIGKASSKACRPT